MDLICRGWKHIIRNETFNNSFSKPSATITKALENKKTSNNFSIRKSTLPFKLITINTENPLTSFYVKKFMEEYHNLIPDTCNTCGKIFTDWFTKCSDGYIVSIWYKFIHFPLLLNLAIHRTDNSPNILCPRCREQDESHSHFIFQLQAV